MTEWNGIKVGGLYTDKLDTRYGEPAVMVCISMCEILAHQCNSFSSEAEMEAWIRAQNGEVEAEVTFLWRGELAKHRIPRDWAGWNLWCLPEHKAEFAAGPYVEVV